MEKYVPRLLIDYNSKIKEELKKKLNIENIMRVPKVKKIVLNVGMGDARDNKTSFKQAIEELTLIAGQNQLSILQKKQFQTLKSE